MESLEREAEESVAAKADLAEEIMRGHSEFDATELPSHVKAPARPSNRRRKIRIYIP
jgi:RecB family exonuclease